MLEESKDIKLGFRYGQARTLFEDDPRWKVGSISWHYTSLLALHLSAASCHFDPSRQAAAA